MTKHIWSLRFLSSPKNQTTNHHLQTFCLSNLTSYLLPLCLLLSVIFFVPDTFAQNIGSLSVSTSANQSSLQGFGQFASVFINIFTFLALLILSLVGDLMGTDFITGPEAMDALRPIWMYVRNLVNISAVLMIVYLSFSNLFSNLLGEGGGGSWSWQIKDKLPRIIFMLVAVNFSLLGFRLVIDAIHIGSITILSVADTQLESNSAESIDRILTGNKWRRVMKDSVEIIEEQMPDPKQSGQTVDKYAEWNRDAKTNGFFEKLEGKTCEDALQDGTLSDTDREKGKKLWTQARYFNEKTKMYEADQDSVLVCGSFNEQINSTFCAEGVSDDDCFFRIKSDFSFRNQQVKPGNKTAQNLFMAFGVMFMRIEQLPSLAANIENIFQVIDNTLFSALMAIMYVLALAALFFVLIARILILWLAIAFSPVVIGISIMGINTPGGGITEKVVTHLLVPIKIAAAFAISFVMMSSMIDFKPAGRLGIFEFGPSLSAIAVDEYAIMWQIATVIIFWRAAKWALEGTEADAIVKGIFDSAQTVGEYALKAATIENQIFSVKNKGQEYKLSLQGLLDTPKKVAEIKMSELEAADRDFYYSFGKEQSLEDISKLGSTIAKDAKDYATQFRDSIKRIGLDKAAQNGDKYYEALENKARNIQDSTQRSQVQNVLKKYEQDIRSGKFALSAELGADIINKLSLDQLKITAADLENTLDTKPKSDLSVTYTPDTDESAKTTITLNGTTKADGTELTDSEKKITLNLDNVKNADKAEPELTKLNTAITNITGETADTDPNRSVAKTVFTELQAGKTPEEVWDNNVQKATNLDPQVREIFKYIIYDLKQVELKDKDDKTTKLKAIATKLKANEKLGSASTTTAATTPATDDQPIEEAASDEE